jgi:hypothetical protein
MDPRMLYIELSHRSSQRRISETSSLSRNRGAVTTRSNSARVMEERASNEEREIGGLTAAELESKGS